MSGAMICAKNIVKNYGTVKALCDVSLEVRKGEIFGVIGPDGAGKTTLIRVLTTLLMADSGSASVDNLDVVQDYKKIRSRIGYMPGRFSLYQDLSVEENLEFFATVFNTTIKENYYLIRDIYSQLEPFKKRRAGDLSGGMKQKLALSCALIHKPVVLFLDEPTTGVDPVSRKEFWEMLRRLKEQGISILVSTPYMDEAGLCDRIALMKDGKFLRIDTPDNIIDQFEYTLWAARSSNMYSLLNDIRDRKEVISCFAFGDTHHITVNNGSLAIETLEKYLRALGHSDLSITPVRAGIEDCFMALTGRIAYAGRTEDAGTEASTTEDGEIKSGRTALV